MKIYCTLLRSLATKMLTAGCLGIKQLVSLTRSFEFNLTNNISHKQPLRLTDENSDEYQTFIPYVRLRKKASLQSCCNSLRANGFLYLFQLRNAWVEAFQKCVVLLSHTAKVHYFAYFTLLHLIQNHYYCSLRNGSKHKLKYWHWWSLRLIKPKWWYLPG